MTRRVPREIGRRPPFENQAFDLWLKSGLRKLFGNVLDEPVPEALLRLVRNPKPNSIVGESPGIADNAEQKKE
ncbi:hypothetical protein [Acetobacter malorum]|uniref:hypothetical protein n=1 Tax=Acetobacter malorum TaxID=178901 RepID=UPI000777BE6A|nr:hypothetical protein [Acetobacter malorum]KXV05497.1 hypothetical protein AD930_12755 [Acetobacter malorum]